MFFCSGIPNVYSDPCSIERKLKGAGIDEIDIDDANEYCSSIQSPDLLFIACVTGNSLRIWSITPTLLIGTVEMEAASVIQLGRNQHLVWHSDSRTIAISTEKGSIIFYALEEAPSAFVSSTNAHVLTVGVNLVKPINYKLVFNGIISYIFDEISAICCFKEDLLVFHQKKPHIITRITEWRAPLKKEKEIFMFPPERIISIEYYELSDVAVWLTENRKLYVRPNASINSVGWNGVQVPMEDDDKIFYFSLNVKYRLLAVATQNCLYCFKVGYSYELAWKKESCGKSVVSMKWSATYFMLIVDYLNEPFCVFSYLGDDLMHYTSEAHILTAQKENLSFLKGSFDGIFSIGDYSLMLFPKKPSNSYSIISFPLTRTPSLADNSTITRRNLSMLKDDSFLIARPLQFQNAHYDEKLVSFENVSFPSDYLTEYFPIRITSQSPTGNTVFIAGSRGFCMYMRSIRKWKRLSSSPVESSFLVVCSPVWFNEYLFLCCNNLQDEIQLRVYVVTGNSADNKDKGDFIDEDDIVYKQMVPCRIVNMCICDNFLFTFNLNASLVIYEFLPSHYQPPVGLNRKNDNQTKIPFKMSVRNVINLSSLVAEPILVSNLFIQKSRMHSSFNHNQQPPVQTDDQQVNMYVKGGTDRDIPQHQSPYSLDFDLFVLQGGQLDLATVNVGEGTIVNPSSISNNIYYFLVENSVLMCFKGKSLDIFMDYSIVGSPPDIKINVSDIYSDSCNYSFISNVSLQTGIVMGLQQSVLTNVPMTTTDAAMPQSFDGIICNQLIFECKSKVESLTTKLLKYFLFSADNIQLARQTACQNGALLPFTFETLLWESFQDYLANDHKNSFLLRQALLFIQEFPCWECSVISVARKTDSRHWLEYFGAIGTSAMDLFNSCLKKMFFVSALGCLIILREFYAEEEVIECCVDLVDKLLSPIDGNFDCGEESLHELPVRPSTVADMHLFQSYLSLQQRPEEDRIGMVGEILRFLNCFVQSQKISIDGNCMASVKNATTPTDNSADFSPSLSSVGDVLWKRAMWYLCKGFLHTWYQLVTKVPQISVKRCFESCKDVSVEAFLIGLHIDYQWYLFEDKQFIQLIHILLNHLKSQKRQNHHLLPQLLHHDSPFMNELKSKNLDLFFASINYEKFVNQIDEIFHIMQQLSADGRVINENLYTAMNSFLFNNTPTATATNGSGIPAYD